jgi:hypothetical protein
MQVGIPTRFLCHFGHHKSLGPAWNVIKGESLNVVGRVAAAELQWQQPDMASVSGSLFLSLSLSVSLLNTLSFSLSRLHGMAYQAWGTAGELADAVLL